MIKLTKRAQVGGTTWSWIDKILGVIVLLYAGAAFIPVLQGALGNISVLGVPLASFFTPTGVIMLLVMVGIVYAVIKGTRPNTGK